MDSITYQGRTYCLGEAGTPLHLETIAPRDLPKGWQEIDATRWANERDYGRAYRSTTGLIISSEIPRASALGRKGGCPIRATPLLRRMPHTALHRLQNT
jgi:hypothetical protein